LPQSDSYVESSPEEASGDQTVSTDSSVRRGIFNFIRLLAAVLVLLSHSFPLSSRGSRDDVLGSTTLGEIGVSIFFVLSGFFVYQSSMNRGFLHFIVLRIGRVIPPLILVNFTTAFLLFPVCTSSTFDSLFTIDSNGPVSYFLLNSTLIFGLQAGIKDLFVDLPYPLAVNGSLWTLPIEIKLYFLLSLIALVTKKMNSRGPFLVLFLSSYLFYFLTELQWVENRLLPASTLNLTILFLTGSLLACFDLKWGRLKSHRAKFLAIFLIFLISFLGIDSLKPIIYACLIPALTIVPVKISKLFEFFRNRDYSYGVYLWAFPVQQLIMHLSLADNALSLIIFSLPASLILAAISWHLVEKRILLSIRNRL
jgi:peptidoglycan/LPS O-acetylase OafA/YrhL